MSEAEGVERSMRMTLSDRKTSCRDHEQAREQASTADLCTASVPPRTNELFPVGIDGREYFSYAYIERHRAFVAVRSK